MEKFQPHLTPVPRTELQQIEAEVRAWPSIKRFVLSERYNYVTIEFLDVFPSFQNKGAGTAAVRMVQSYANRSGIPILLVPNPDPRKKTALQRFYRRLGFYPNRGRKGDSSIGSIFGGEWIWKPKFNIKIHHQAELIS